MFSTNSLTLLVSTRKESKLIFDFCDMFDVFFVVIRQVSDKCNSQELRFGIYEPN